MFVRLFVDENLDRMVPISKQPKEKIQAIIDSCTRQFPEFAERARKRIRTYLKSCRRNKRARDPSASWDAVSYTNSFILFAPAVSFDSCLCVCLCAHSFSNRVCKFLLQIHHRVARNVYTHYSCIHKYSKFRTYWNL